MDNEDENLQMFGPWVTTKKVQKILKDTENNTIFLVEDGDYVKVVSYEKNNDIPKIMKYIIGSFDSLGITDLPVDLTSFKSVEPEYMSKKVYDHNSLKDPLSGTTSGSGPSGTGSGPSGSTANVTACPSEKVCEVCEAFPQEILECPPEKICPPGNVCDECPTCPSGNVCDECPTCKTCPPEKLCPPGNVCDECPTNFKIPFFATLSISILIVGILILMLITKK